jgi:hypothetical protein
MKTIPRDQVIESWDELCEMEEGSAEELVQQFLKEQPALGMYLFANNETLEEGAEDSPIISLAIVAWRVLSRQAAKPLREVTPEEIEQAEEANTRRLEELEEASEAEWEGNAQGLVQNYNQRELLGFGIEVMMSGEEEAPDLAPDRVGLEMLWFKTIIDCLDQ